MKRILLLFFVLFTFLIVVPINVNALIVDFGSTTSVVETGINGSGEEYRYIDVLANEAFDITISIGLVDFTSAAFGFDISIDNSIDNTEISYSGYTINDLFYNPLPADPFQVDGVAFHDTHNIGLLTTLSLNAGSMVGTGILDIDGPFNIQNFTGLYDLLGTNLNNVDLEGSLLINIESNPIPEPGTILLVGMGLLGLAGISRKKR